MGAASTVSNCSGSSCKEGQKGIHLEVISKSAACKTLCSFFLFLRQIHIVLGLAVGSDIARKNSTAVAILSPVLRMGGIPLSGTGKGCQKTSEVLWYPQA